MNKLLLVFKPQSKFQMRVSCSFPYIIYVPKGKRAKLSYLKKKDKTRIGIISHQ